MKLMQRYINLASLLCLLTACATMQLAHMKQLQNNGRYDAIIAETPATSCNDPSQSSEVCRQFYAIRGHAYLKLTMNESQAGSLSNADPIGPGQYGQCGKRLCACIFCRRQRQRR